MKKASKAEQIKLKPPSVFQLGFCDPGPEEAIQQNCLVDLPRPGRLCLHQPAFSRVVSLTTTPPLPPLSLLLNHLRGSSKWGSSEVWTWRYHILNYFFTWQKMRSLVHSSHQKSKIYFNQYFDLKLFEENQADRAWSSDLPFVDGQSQQLSIFPDICFTNCSCPRHCWVHSALLLH